MPKTYAPYLQLRPLQTDLDASEYLDQYNKQKALEAADLARKRKSYLDSAKRIADYQSKFKIEDVQYHYNDEMMRVHDVAQKELYDIHVAREKMKMSGNVDTDQLRELNSRQEALLTIPKQLKASFDSFNNVLVDYNKKVGVKGGYDDILNQDIIEKLYGVMNDNSWKYDEKTREYVFKNPADKTEKRMSPGQFMMNPTIYGRLEAYVDVDEEEKRLVGLIGAETTKYVTKDNGTITRRRSKAVSERERNNIRNILSQELDDKDNLLTKVGVQKNLTKDQYIDYIMDIAGIKEDISTLEGRPPTTFGLKLEDYYKNNFSKKTSERYSLWNDDKKQPGLGEYEIDNYLALPESASYNISPQRLVVLSPEEPVGKAGTIDFPAYITANRISDVRTDVPGFKQTGIGEVKVYNGDLEYRVTYTDENGETSVKSIVNGDVIPSEAFNGDFKLELKTEVPRMFHGTKVAYVPPQGDEFKTSTETIPMVFGIGKIGGNSYKIGIPNIEKNKKAITSINVATQKIKPFRKTGAVNDYMNRRESGEFYSETDTKQYESETAGSFDISVYANKTAAEIMKLDPEITQEDAEIMEGKSAEELNQLIE